LASAAALASASARAFHQRPPSVPFLLRLFNLLLEIVFELIEKDGPDGVDDGRPAVRERFCESEIDARRPGDSCVCVWDMAPAITGPADVSSPPSPPPVSFLPARTA
jgi:hypothetical protein